MAGAGPLSAEALAAKTGLHPRWLLEWMRLQAAGRVLYYRGDDRFVAAGRSPRRLVDSGQFGVRRQQFPGRSFAGATGRLMQSFRTGSGKT